MKGKFAKSFILASTLFCVYTAGKIIGHMDCMKNIMKKYGDNIPGDRIEDDVCAHFTITLNKKEKA